MFTRHHSTSSFNHWKAFVEQNNSTPIKKISSIVFTSMARRSSCWNEKIKSLVFSFLDNFIFSSHFNSSFIVLENPFFDFPSFFVILRIENMFCDLVTLNKIIVKCNGM